jgi:hypothetical protein
MFMGLIFSSAELGSGRSGSVLGIDEGFPALFAPGYHFGLVGIGPGGDSLRGDVVGIDMMKGVL